MPRKSSRGLGVNASYKMINIDFSYEDRDTINAWIEQTETTLSDAILVIADSGFKVSFSRDDYHDYYVSSLTRKKKPAGAKETPVYIIRHADLFKLFKITCYFFIVRLTEGESDYENDGTEHDW